MGQIRRTCPNNFFRDQRGLESVEYAIISGLITAITLAAVAAAAVWVAARLNLMKVTIGA